MALLVYPLISMAFMLRLFAHTTITATKGLMKLTSDAIEQIVGEFATAIEETLDLAPATQNFTVRDNGFGVQLKL